MEILYFYRGGSRINTVKAGFFGQKSVDLMEGPLLRLC